jgi:hypothetical protein
MNFGDLTTLSEVAIMNDDPNDGIQGQGRE